MAAFSAGMVAVTESYGYASTIDALDANLEAIAANTFRRPTCCL
ncbi:MAG: hypothetical protein ACLRRT_15395 [Ruthenibacterium lactatiformans]